MRPEEDWIKLPDDEQAKDEHDAWLVAFMVLLAILTGALLIATLNGGEL